MSTNERYYYIEMDGMVYLIKPSDGGRWTLPSEADKANIPFAFEPKARMVIQGHEVLYCVPQIEHYPRDWVYKDEIPGRDDVEPLVRLAVHHTLPRVVAEALIVKDENVLLVKPSRGFNKGMWTLPGGFVSYGESPAESVQREVEEEVGAPCRVKRLLGVESFLGRESYYTWHMFFYEAEVLSDEFRPAPDEIEAVRWVALEEAFQLLKGVKRKALELYLNSRSKA